MKHEIYPDRQKELIREKKRLETAQISPRNKELINEFVDFLISTGNTGQLRSSKLASQLRKICSYLIKKEITKDLDDLNLKEITKLLSFINQIDTYTEATRSDYRRCIKQFFNWYQTHDKRFKTSKSEETQKFYHYLNKEMKVGYKLQQADPNTIITEEQIDYVTEHGTNRPMDKAILQCLHEWGVRSSEFLYLKVGDIEIDPEKGIGTIHVPDGKTGRRIVYSYKSFPYIIKYLETHPKKNDKNSYLWLSQSNSNRHQPIIHKGLAKILDTCFERAGKSNIKHNPHWFRHSRASILAPKVTESVLCRFMGWSLGSKQIKVYVHLCVKDMQNAFFNMHGLREAEQNKEEPVKCMCGQLCHPAERYCFRCYRPLRVETALQDQQVEVQNLNMMQSETVKTLQYFMEMSKNPEMMERFEEFKKAMTDGGN